MELLGDFTMHHHIVTVTMEIDHRPCFVVDNLDFYCDLTRMVYCTVNVMGTKQTDPPPVCLFLSLSYSLSTQAWWTGRSWSRWSGGTVCPAPRAAQSPSTRWWSCAGRRTPMRGPPSSTSSPSWRTTSQPRSHSTSLGITYSQAWPQRSPGPLHRAKYPSTQEEQTLIQHGD